MQAGFQGRLVEHVAEPARIIQGAAQAGRVGAQDAGHREAGDGARFGVPVGIIAV